MSLQSSLPAGATPVGGIYYEEIKIREGGVIYPTSIMMMTNAEPDRIKAIALATTGRNTGRVINMIPTGSSTMPRIEQIASQKSATPQRPTGTRFIVGIFFFPNGGGGGPFFVCWGGPPPPPRGGGSGIGSC